MSSQEEPRYVRFGNLPRKSYSRNALTNKRLEGVSVYEGWLDQDRGFIIDTTSLNDEMGRSDVLAIAACDRPAFFIEGEKVGRGPDGEPLVSVERACPVPKTTNITSTEIYAQDALRLWSHGPRDGSGHKYVKERLTGYTEYTAEGMYIFDPSVLQTLASNPTKRLGGKRPDHKRKAQKQARKKQRTKK